MSGSPNISRKADTRNIKRFRDTGETLYSFRNEIFVQCPRCNSCAILRRIAPNNTDYFAPHKFSCKACGASKDWSRREIKRPHLELVDDYFHYPLWLQTLCCSQILWAYNLQHLEFIEGFVRAKLRESKPDEHGWWSNRSLFSRLPKWIQSRKNREEIIKAIAKIRKSV